MKIVAYTRVSGKGQICGEGRDRQKESIDRFCAAHNLINKGEFFDSISGTVDSLDRPAFVEMLAAVESLRNNGENVEAVVVERQDRLARDLVCGELLLGECRKRNLKVFSSDRGEKVDLAANDCDPTATLVRQVIACISAWDRSQIVLKLKKAREAIAAKTGKPCGGGIPYGANATEQLVLKMLKLFVRPDNTLQQVANLLNREGFRTRRNRLWDVKSALKIMKVAGVWVRKEPVAYRLKNFGDSRMIGEVNVGQLRTA